MLFTLSTPFIRVLQCWDRLWRWYTLRYQLLNLVDKEPPTPGRLDSEDESVLQPDFTPEVPRWTAGDRYSMRDLQRGIAAMSSASYTYDFGASYESIVSLRDVPLDLHFDQ